MWRERGCEKKNSPLKNGNVTITDLMRLLNYVSGKSATL